MENLIIRRRCLPLYPALYSATNSLDTLETIYLPQEARCSPRDIPMDAAADMPVQQDPLDIHRSRSPLP